MPIDLQDTRIAFERKTDGQLRKMAWLFGMMSSSFMVRLGSRLGLLGLRLRLPVEGVIRNTVFEQFCGGASLEECLETVRELAAYGVETVLDYGSEAKESEADFDRTLGEFLKAVAFAGANRSMGIVSLKVTGLARFAILQKIGAGQVLGADQQESWDRTLARLDRLCRAARAQGAALFLDAEESWIQEAIDRAADLMMERHNQDGVVVYNTFQMYRHDRLAFLRRSCERARQKGYLLGAKLVRGAYMEKERERARKKGYPSPIHTTKEATDRDYDAAVAFCVHNHEHIASCVASHNQRSTALALELMDALGLPKNHPHLSSCQLYGMSDHLTFNLARAGYRVGKYVPYGPVREVVPYLVRRARENSSTAGEVGRELQLIRAELRRRRPVVNHRRPRSP